MEIKLNLDNLYKIQEYRDKKVGKVINGSISIKEPSEDGDITRTFSNLKKIGQGYNATVYYYNDNGQEYILKVGDNRALLIEWLITKSLENIRYNVLPILFHDDDFTILVKPYLKPDLFANKILENRELNEQETASLEKLWRKSNEFALITGIPLDLKSDNLWFDSIKKEWILVDAGPKLDDNDHYKYEFTLDPNNIIDLLEVWKTGKHIGKYTTIVKNNDKYELYIKSVKGIEYKFDIPNTITDYNEEQKKLYRDTLEAIKETTNNSNLIERVLIYLQAVPITAEIVRYAENNIKLRKALCDVNHICIKGKSISPEPITRLKENVDVIRQLKNDTKNYHEKLSSKAQSVLSEYTGLSYRKINKCLRNTNERLSEFCPDSIINDIEILDKTLSNGPRITKDITVYRGINPNDEDAPEVVRALKALHPGDLWEDRGFVSTSIQYPPSSFVGPTCCIMKIHLRAGTPAYYIGKRSSTNWEEEIILIPGITLRFMEEKTGDQGIEYKKGRYVTTYIFDCVGCNLDNRFAISHIPKELETKGEKMHRLDYQPQDTTVGKNRLSYFHLVNMYDKFIPRKTKNIFRVMSWNVHEWRDAEGNKQNLENSIKELNPDVLGLQEVTGSLIGDSCIADMGSHGEKLRNELVVKKSIEKLFVNKIDLGSDRCMIVAGVKVFDEIIVIGNLHLEVSSSKNRLKNIEVAIKNIEDIAKNHETKNIILMGDFNSYDRSDYDDRQFQELAALKENLHQGMNIFEAIDYIKGLGYIDTFRNKPKPVNTNYYGGRIDFIFLSPQFSPSIVLIGAYAYYTGLSDHISILADFASKNNQSFEGLLLGEEQEKKKFSMNEFLTAVNRGDLEGLKYLERHGIYTEEQYNRALSLASEKGRLETVKYLVEHGANIHSFNDEPLRLASEKGHLEVVKYLVEHGADIHADDEYVLRWASGKGNLELAKYLIEHGANIHVSKDLPLILASGAGHLEIVKYLVENGADIHAEYDTALRLASKYGHLETAKYLAGPAQEIYVKLKNEEKRFSMEKFLIAANKGDLEALKYLKQHKIDTQEEYDKTLQWASGNGHLNTVKYLLQHGANIHSFSDEALQWASENGHLAVVKYLVENGADIHALSDSALRQASKSGHLEVVKYLVEHGADIHASNEFALELAKENKHWDVVRYLTGPAKEISKPKNEKKRFSMKQFLPAANKGDLEAIAYLADHQIHTQEQYDEALQWASGNGHLAVVKYLVKHGANIHGQDNYALRQASYNGYLKVVKYLVENGADIHANNDFALRYASQNGYLDVVKYLVQHGADIHARNDEALRDAILHGHLDIVKYLGSLTK